VFFGIGEIPVPFPLAGKRTFLNGKNGSVIPAALIHALTNAIPNVYAGFLQVNETLYQSSYVRISLISMLPLAAVGGIALWRLQNFRKCHAK
jgi:hypothetical protein